MSGRTAVLGSRRIMVFVVALGGLFVLFFPARQLVAQRERIESLTERRDALVAENRRLAEEAARLADPAELEVLARERLGLVRAGDRAYFVEPTVHAPSATKTDSSRGLWNRAWTWFTSLVRGHS